MLENLENILNELMEKACYWISVFVPLPNQECLLWYFSSVLHSTFCVQNNKVYHLLDVVIPYSSPVSRTLDSQTSFVAHVRTGLFPPVHI